MNNEQLTNIIKIKEMLCLRMSDIAYLLDISKDTVYSYLDSKTVSKSVLLSLKLLFELGELFEKEHIERLDTFLDRPLVNSPSLIELLKDAVDKGIIDRKKTLKIIKTIKGISEREKENRLKSKGSGINLRSLEDVSGDFSKAYIEEK